VTWPRAFAARPVTWLCLTAAVVVVEYLAGPHLQLGVLYLGPVALAAWYGRLRVALAIALVLPAVRRSYFVFGVWEPPGRLAHTVVNAVVRITALAIIAVLLNRTRRARALERELTTLRGLLPICMYCKRIEGSDGRWDTVEQYVAARSEAAFTHRVCPLCANTHRNVFLGGRGTSPGGG